MVLHMAMVYLVVNMGAKTGTGTYGAELIHNIIYLIAGSERRGGLTAYTSIHYVSVDGLQ